MIMRSNLKQLREAKGISKYKLAKETGINRPLIDKIEECTVQEIPVYALSALCEFFKKPIQSIIYFEDEKKLKAEKENSIHTAGSRQYISFLKNSFLFLVKQYSSNVLISNNKKGIGILYQQLTR